MEALLAELIVPEIVRPGTQAEILGRHEGPECAAFLADRAIAGDDVAEVCRHFEAHLAAVAPPV